ncbi:EamA family transporter, partial [Acinetobacter baumannii]
AALALLLVGRIARVRSPDRDHLVLLAAAALVGMAADQVLLNAGELHVPAGTASLVVATAPLFSVAIAAAAFGERLTVTKLAGSIVAIVGVT